MRGSFEMGKSAKVHKRTVRPMLLHGTQIWRSLTQNHQRTPEKDNEQRQRFHTRGAAIAVQVRASANGRSVRSEKIAATQRNKTRKGRLESRDRRVECECECGRWCVVVDVVRASCARRCGLRGYRDGQSTAGARRSAKAASSRVTSRAGGATQQ